MQGVTEEYDGDASRARTDVEALQNLTRQCGGHIAEYIGVQLLDPTSPFATLSGWQIGQSIGVCLDTLARIFAKTRLNAYSTTPDVIATLKYAIECLKKDSNGCKHLLEHCLKQSLQLPTSMPLLSPTRLEPTIVPQLLPETEAVAEIFSAAAKRLAVAFGWTTKEPYDVVFQLSSLCSHAIVNMQHQRELAQGVPLVKESNFAKKSSIKRGRGDGEGGQKGTGSNTTAAGVSAPSRRLSLSHPRFG